MRVWAASLLLLLSVERVGAVDLGPGSRLMLAAIVAQHSPLVSVIEKRTMADLAAGNLVLGARKSRSITVTAADVECRASNVDITSRSCRIRFDHRTVTLKGRDANELFATLAEMGIEPTGAAGSVFIGLSQLSCVVDPGELWQKAGGGIECSFKPSIS